MKGEKWALITGAAGGLGRELAYHFAREGYHLFLTTGSQKGQLIALSEDLKKDYSISVKLNVGDLSMDETILTIYEELMRSHIILDTLILNAAFDHDALLDDMTRSSFLKVLDVNLVSPFLLIKKLKPCLCETSNIILISSTNGIDTLYKESLEYDASKAGLINLGHNLASILAPVRVNTICPGWIDTPMNATLNDEFKTAEINKILLKRFAHPKEVAEVAVFLASKKANYINDAVIRVDGGINRE